MNYVDMKSIKDVGNGEYEKEKRLVKLNFVKLEVKKTTIVTMQLPLVCYVMRVVCLHGTSRCVWVRHVTSMELL